MKRVLSVIVYAAAVCTLALSMTGCAVLVPAHTGVYVGTSVVVPPQVHYHHFGGHHRSPPPRYHYPRSGYYSHPRHFHRR